MGFSVSGATVLLLLAFLVSGVTLATTLEDVSEARNAGVDAEEERLLDRLNTGIELTGAVYNETTETLTVTGENSGSMSLNTGVTDLLVDGEFAEISAVTIGNVSNRTLWTPGTVARLTVDAVTTRPSRVKLVTNTGVTAVRTEIASES